MINNGENQYTVKDPTDLNYRGNNNGNGSIMRLAPIPIAFRNE